MTTEERTHTSPLKNIFISLSEIIDALRVVPVATTFLYLYYVYRISEWFMTLKDPTMPQTSFAMASIGAAGIVFAFYVKTGKQWANPGTWIPPTNQYILKKR